MHRPISAVAVLATLLTLPAAGLAAPAGATTEKATDKPAEKATEKAADKVPDLLHLAIGDPARRDRTVDLVVDGITDTATGSVLTPEEVAAELADVRLVFFGEQHTSMDVHRAQLRLLQALQATGRPLLIGLEMFPYTAQEGLDHWTSGLLTEEGFLELGDWYEHWGLNWGYYRDIFLFARDYGVPMFGVNTPREVVTAVREKGLDNLSPEERALLPPSLNMDGPGTEDHRRLFRAFFEQQSGTIHSSMSDEQLESMRAAQVTWDGTMAYNAVRILKDRPDDAIMVVLIGSGHVAYGLGAERQARHWFDGKMATVVPVAAEDDDEDDESSGPVRTVEASYADYVWGLPGDEQLLYPSLGASTTEADGGRRVIFVPEDSVAARAGIQVGDVIVAVDGAPVPDKAAFSRALGAYRWGDRARFTVSRDGAETAVDVIFRRTVDEDDE